MKPFFSKIFKYNIWRHEQIYEAVNKYNNIDELLTLLTRPSSSLYFKTVMGTFNHILIADILWLSRLKGIENIRIPTIDKEINIKELSTLWSDSNINKFTDYFDTNHDWLKDHQIRQIGILFQFLEIIELPCLELNSKIIYNDTMGNKSEKIFSDCLFHIVNHHTHHLGQVSTSLKLYGINISTDYTFYI